VQVPLRSLLGGKAAPMEAPRPPRCLLSTDAHRNSKENMPIATEMPGSLQKTGVAATGGSSIPVLHDHTCSQAVRRDVKCRDTSLSALVPCNGKETYSCGPICSADT